MNITVAAPTTESPTDIAIDRRGRPLWLKTPLGGTVWFGGWLFTLGFAQLGFWKGVLAIVAWPYFLGALAH